MEKDSLLLGFSFVTDMDRKDHTTENGKYMDFSEKIEKQICKVADEYEIQVECYSSSIRLLDEKNNCGRCVICNEWVSAQNKPSIKTELGLGAEYEEKLFCQQHLPKDSPMYSKLFPVWEREEE